MWPVILRELRSASRQWTTYWLRLLSAAAVVVAILFWLSSARSLAPHPGGNLFAHIHRIVLVATWVLVPLLTCDCISSERREGTLGLLFLTNLRARHIICAKAFIHVVKAFTLWAAVIPIVAVPLLMGGLHWKELVFSIGWTLGSICLATAAGIAASSASSSLRRAAFSAIVLSGCFFILFTVLAAIGSAVVLTRLMPRPAVDLSNFGEIVEFAGALLLNYDSAWTEVFASTALPLRAQNALVTTTYALAVVCFALLIGVIALAAVQIRRDWQDKPKTKRQTKMEHFFCAPVFWTSLFRRWMRWSLERNPIGWLEKRSWIGRIAALIWLSVMISFASAVASYTSTFRGDGASVLQTLMWMLLVSIAYVAAGSFRRERETGALELILVSPLREREIILGRLRGIWGQFLPAFLVWAAVIIYLYSWNKTWEPSVLLRFAAIYFVVPIVGLYFSLRTRIVLIAWAATLTFTFGLLQLLMIVLNRIATSYFVWHSIPIATPPRSIRIGFAAAIWFAAPLLLAILFLWRLHVNLRQRSFSLR